MVVFMKLDTLCALDFLGPGGVSSAFSSDERSYIYLGNYALISVYMQVCM